MTIVPGEFVTTVVSDEFPTEVVPGACCGLSILI